MSYKIQDIEGIGPTYGQKLSMAKIETTEDLLAICDSAKGRETVSKTTGIGASQLLKWTNMADLMRISGVGSEFSELLEAAGVDTIKELRNRNAENLAAKMAEINADKKLTRTSPSAEVVQKWISGAAELPPIVTY